jgi:hypothetical protein
MLSPTERQQLLDLSNDTKTDYPEDKCIHELFEIQVEFGSHRAYLQTSSSLTENLIAAPTGLRSSCANLASVLTGWSASAWNAP